MNQKVLPAFSPTTRSPAVYHWLVRPEMVAPAIVGLSVLLFWELAVRFFGIPSYLLPGPFLVLQTLVMEWTDLFPSLIVTLQITLVAFLLATLSGVLIAVLFAQSKWVERSFFPYAVILQTTPIVAIAPLTILWFRNNTFAALVVCAWIVAFFPIVSNTTLGLKSADHTTCKIYFSCMALLAGKPSGIYGCPVPCPIF